MMQSSVKSLCPACFRETLKQGICTACGYRESDAVHKEDVLEAFTILRGKYLLGNDLGQGGFGITYRAKNLQNGMLCCVKEYYPSGLLAGRKEDGSLCLMDENHQKEFDQGKHRFLEEAKALQELRGNVSVVDIWDYFEENGTAYFVMELLEGCNLRTFQKEHTPEQNFKMSVQMLFLIGSALVEVHRFGLIHGDISPENMIITKNGDIKLIDFGAARSFRQGEKTEGYKIYLKPNYAPYEQYSVKLCQGPWTDLYALAATFYFIVTGQYVVDALKRAKGAKYVPMSELSPFVSRRLSNIMDCALAFDYHDRYKSLTAFMSDLQKAVQPQDYDIDLAALVSCYSNKTDLNPKSDNPEPEKADQVCMIMPQAVAEPRARGGLFRHKKKGKMAWLELTIQNGSSDADSVKRRWLIEPNRMLTIGRLASSNVMMPANNRISRTHCELYYNEKRQDFVLKDVSKFGTFLSDGTPMEKERLYALKDKDCFYVVSPVYKFRVVIEK